MKSDLNRLKEIFKQMKQDNFNIQSDLKWGFFFINKKKDGLLCIYNELKQSNYSLERIWEDNNGYWNLHVSKIDKLTPEKLHKRNISFNQLADFFSIELYDGWDVERV